MTLSFWLILLAVLSYGVLHTLLASLKAKALTRHWFGRHADRWFRLAYNFFATITLLPILVLPIVLIDNELYRIPLPWMIGTLVIQAIAVVTVLFSLRQTGLTSFIGLQQLLLPEANDPPRLIIGGLYRYMRHPAYTAGLVFIWLFPIMTCNLLALNIGLTAYIILGAYFEERKMLTEFGEAYADYRRQTPMLIPWLRLRFPHRRA
jgi:methanethiol S-methyltransferase